VSSGLGKIAVLDRAQARELIRILADAKDEIFEIGFAVNDGLKLKINQGTWSPPLGRIYDPTKD